MYLNLNVRRIVHIASVTCRCAAVPAPQSPFTANTNGIDARADLDVEGDGLPSFARGTLDVHATRRSIARAPSRLTARPPSALSRDPIDQSRQPDGQIFGRPRCHEVAIDDDRLVHVLGAGVHDIAFDRRYARYAPALVHPGPCSSWRKWPACSIVACG